MPQLTARFQGRESRLGQSAPTVSPPLPRWLAWLLLSAWLLVLAGLGGCATRPFTVDDGRKLDEALLGQIRAFGAGERAVRPAIARSAELADAQCDKQWELPFSVASSAAWSDNERVAWVRALGVDERLTVVAAASLSPLQVGERLQSISGKKADEDAEAALGLLAERRDVGKPFQVATTAGRQATVHPFQVCRGYTRFAPPSTPKLQDYHWLLSMHPLELTEVTLSDDEALWLVLWTQGLSEEGGARMKTYHYGTQIVGTLYNLATLASGLKGAALAADLAMKAAQSAATSMATEFLKQQLIEQAKKLAADRLRGLLSDQAERAARAMVVSSMQQAAVNRGLLGGVARVGATVFDRADTWAFERMPKLHANPLAGFALHQKLAESGLASNALIFDAERLESLSKVAQAKGLQDQVQTTLRGLRPGDLVAELASMPLASAPSAVSYDDPVNLADNPFAGGLVNALLDMPVSGQGKK